MSEKTEEQLEELAALTTEEIIEQIQEVEEKLEEAQEELDALPRGEDASEHWQKLDAIYTEQSELRKLEALLPLLAAVESLKEDIAALREELKTSGKPHDKLVTEIIDSPTSSVLEVVGKDIPHVTPKRGISLL